MAAKNAVLARSSSHHQLLPAARAAYHSLQPASAYHQQFALRAQPARQPIGAHSALLLDDSDLSDFEAVWPQTAGASRVMNAHRAPAAAAAAAYFDPKAAEFNQYLLEQQQELQHQQQQQQVQQVQVAGGQSSDDDADYFGVGGCGQLTRSRSCILAPAAAQSGSNQGGVSKQSKYSGAGSSSGGGGGGKKGGSSGDQAGKLASSSWDSNGARSTMG